MKLESGARTSSRIDEGRYRDRSTVVVGGIETAIVDRASLASQMVSDCLAARISKAPSRLVFSSNGQAISMAARDPSFKKVLEQADIVHADGMSVVRASQLVTNSALPERVATTDFFHDAARAAAASGLSFFMLGGQENQNRIACERIAEMYPDLRIAGRHHGYFSRAEDAAICALVRESGADVLWVGLGRPLQEIWALENRARLSGVGWIKTCGGLYGFLSGDAARAPGWMQDLGFEWFFRLVQEPRRLAWRYLTSNVHALYLLATASR